MVSTSGSLMEFLPDTVPIHSPISPIISINIEGLEICQAFDVNFKPLSCEPFNLISCQPVYSSPFHLDIIQVC